MKIPLYDTTVQIINHHNYTQVVSGFAQMDAAPNVVSAVLLSTLLYSYRFLVAALVAVADYAKSLMLSKNENCTRFIRKKSNITQ